MSWWSRRTASEAFGYPFFTWVSGLVPDGSHVIDLGCGSGWMTRALAASSTCVLGIDRRLAAVFEGSWVSPEEPEGNLFWVVGDVLENPVKLEGRFETVVSSFVLHDLSESDIQHMFSRIRGHIRRVVIVDLYDDDQRSPDTAIKILVEEIRNWRTLLSFARRFGFLATINWLVACWLLYSSPGMKEHIRSQERQRLRTFDEYVNQLSAQGQLRAAERLSARVLGIFVEMSP